MNSDTAMKSGSQGQGNSTSFLNHPMVDTSSGVCFPFDTRSSLFNHTHQDSGFYDVESRIPSEKFLDWHSLLLRIWYTNTNRKANRTDSVLFSQLLNAPEDKISDCLYQLFIRDEKSQNVKPGNATRGVAELNDIEGNGLIRGLDLAPNHQHDLRLCQDSNGGNTRLFEYPMLSTHSAPVQSAMNLNDNLGTVGSNSNSKTGAFDDSVHLHGNDSRSRTFSSNTTSRSSNVSGGHVSRTDFAIISQPTALESTFSNQSTYSAMSTDPHPRVPTSLESVRMTPSLRAVIMKLYRTRSIKGCKPIRSHEKQSGIYECTLKCRRRFRSACDLFRHEATVFPQEFYFCTRCGSLEQASERYLFTREDKFRSHNKVIHGDLGPVASFKVPNVPQAFPERCGNCIHFRHRNWRDRCKHIILHYKNGDVIAKYLNDQADRDEIDTFEDHRDDDDDDDDGDDDRDDDDDNDDENNDNDPRDPEAHQKDPPPTGPADDDQPDAQDPQNDPNDFSDIINWISPSCWASGLQVQLVDATGMMTSQTEQSSPPKIRIQWNGRVNQKGGTAPVHRVLASAVGQGEGKMLPQLRVVKQYKETLRWMFEKEKEAYAILNRKEQHPNIIKCFGSFVHRDATGALTYNLLLENAQSDLAEYFADNAPPTTFGEINRFWQKMVGVADALRTIHCQDGYLGWHADLKPDNILVTEGKFVIADFGLSKFVRQEHDLVAREIMFGGTARYSGPELGNLAGQPEPVPVSRSYDIWSFGCLLLETSTWLLGGFDCLRDFEQCRKRASTREGSTNKQAAFHNGQQVLPEVELWYGYLRSLVQKHDDTTGKILNLIQSHLLRGDESLRYDSEQLYKGFKQMKLEFHMPEQHTGRFFDGQKVVLDAAATRRHMHAVATANTICDDFVSCQRASQVNELHLQAGKSLEKALEEATARAVECESRAELSSSATNCHPRSLGKVAFRETGNDTGLSTDQLSEVMRRYVASTRTRTSGVSVSRHKRQFDGLAPASPSSGPSTRPVLASPGIFQDCIKLDPPTVTDNFASGVMTSPTSVSTPSGLPLLDWDEPRLVPSLLPYPSSDFGLVSCFNSIRFEVDNRLAWLQPSDGSGNAANGTKRYCGVCRMCQRHSIVRYKKYIESLLGVHKGNLSLSTTTAKNRLGTDPNLPEEAGLKHYRLSNTIEGSDLKIHTVRDAHLAVTRLARIMDQYLSGRQEAKTMVNVFVDRIWDHDRYLAVETLMAEFWTSRKRRTNRDNFLICFIMICDDAHGYRTLRKLAQTHTFVFWLCCVCSEQSEEYSTSSFDGRMTECCHLQSNHPNCCEHIAADYVSSIDQGIPDSVSSFDRGRTECWHLRSSHSNRDNHGC